MSRLEELIQEFCPDGVELRPLNAVCHYANNRIDVSQISKHTYVGVENLLQNKRGKIPATSVPKTGSVIAFRKDDILIGNIRPYLRKIWLADHDGGTNGDVLTIQIADRKDLMPQFLFYVLSSERFFLYDIQNSKGAKMPRGSKEAVMKYFVPVPPLPVQSEIVQILDNLTGRITELMDRLTEELAMRKIEYNYLCKQVFENADIQTVLSMRDLGVWTGGCTPSMSRSVYWENGTIPWISSKDMKSATLTDTQDHITEKALDETSIKLLPANIVAIVARSGILKHTLPVAYVPFETTVNQDIKALETHANVLPRYAYFTIFSYQKDILKRAKKQGGTVDSLDLNVFMNYQVPVPSIEKQQQIISTLERLTNLYTNLTSGIHTELEARTKQYEYYRDKLLTFKELGT